MSKACPKKKKLCMFGDVPVCDTKKGEWQCQPASPCAPHLAPICTKPHHPFCDVNTGNWCCTPVPSCSWGSHKVCKKDNTWECAQPLTPLTCPQELAPICPQKKPPQCDINTGNWCCGIAPTCPSGTHSVCSKDNTWGCSLTPLTPAWAPLTPAEKKKKDLGLIIGLSVGGGVLLITIILLLVLR
jgi:hypothetical protein